MTNSLHHIKTSLLICNANQLTGFCMMGLLVVNGLISTIPTGFLMILGGGHRSLLIRLNSHDIRSKIW